MNIKRVIWAGIFFSLTGFLQAETVMLFARVQPSVSGDRQSFDRFVAVENGVEDQFYGAGHIIFDTGVPLGAAAAAHTDGWAEQVARSGGADFLLIVNLFFPEDPKAAKASAEGRTPLPTRATYEFLDLRTGSRLAEGSVAARATEGELKTQKPYDLYFAFGRRIAEEVMQAWRPIPAPPQG